MERPYTVRAMAERAGTGEHAPPPQPPPGCLSCGQAVPIGRVYCSRQACIRKSMSVGRTVEKRFDPLPTNERYNA